ncbi:hypothetical protein TraAM80_04035 [Trypanosoma rangeli]|uniref:Uncharacterized protein n=1 Tax=Trypanosoma rangeli TaxID=5698 RepID=A0A422NLE3_TRYRA|nr:uncharacterized protein TraAM80_04035 [Trypanosoma rangeli]RNF06338.1 hypothetical protein TraAM80_04035 [Trypanosoma rangeli]|eukprot:RNF06338.1 hypothetical protein TraAM80_04035 [Trypanosoma rangeli]
MSEKSLRRVAAPATGLLLASGSVPRSDTSVFNQRKKPDHRAQLTCKMTLGDGLICVDFLPGPSMLAIGSTKAVHLVEVTQMTRPSPTAADAPSPPSSAPVFLAMRSCGMFGNVAKVEALAWYPNRGEVVLAIVQLSRNVTVLFDVLSKKGNTYMAQQWIHNSRNRTLVSATVAGSEPLSAAVVGAASTPLTPFGTDMQEVQQASFVERDPGRPCSMVEVVINTGFLRVERIAWDPHNPYTLALTSNATHFELWTIPVVDKRVYPPRLILRPPAHDGRSVTRGVAFSPFDPNLIIVVVEIANAGKVVVYDRRQVEVVWSMDTTGPSLSAAFHPTFSDLLAVSFRKAKTKTNSCVQFFRVVSEVIATPARAEASHCGEKMASAPAPLESTDVLPPIESIDSLNRLQWRPCGGASQTTGGELSVDTTEGSIDATSSKLWFATTALNGHEISVWDAANGFSPIFSIRTVCQGRELGRQDVNQRESTLQELSLQEPTDCVWVNALTLVSVFKDGGVVLTSLLDEKTTSKDTLFRCSTDPTAQASEGSDVLSLSAMLPTAAVVADYFGRGFVVCSTSSLLREYYTKIINAEKNELLEVLALERKNAAGGGLSPSSSVILSTPSKHHRVSSRATPNSGATFDTRHSPQFSHWPQQTTFERRSVGSTTSIFSASEMGTGGCRRLEFLFPLLYSLAASQSQPMGVAATGVERGAVKESAEGNSMEKAWQRSSYVLASDSQHRSSKGGSEVHSEQGLEERASTARMRHSLDGTPVAVATTRRGSFAVGFTPVNEQPLGERHRLMSPITPLTQAMAITSLISSTQSEDGNVRRVRPSAPVGRKYGSVFPMPHETQTVCPNPHLESGVDGGLAVGTATQAAPLGRRSLVKPMIDCFVLSNEMCGWAYVERTAEENTFVLYALQWEMGYDLVRQMKADRNASTGNVDLCFARMMAYNARMCRSRELELQRQSEAKVLGGTCPNANSTDGVKAVPWKGVGNREHPVGSADPRGRLWAAAAHAWRSHNVAIITSLVCSHLDYASLVGDVQFCAVLYLLFRLWWKQRDISVDSYPCPFFSPAEEAVQNGKADKQTPAAATSSSPWQWRMRALQWVEQYVTRLYERKLYVPLNELLVIVPEVMGESSPGLPRAEDVAQKLFTCVYCGTCPKSELVPRPVKMGEMLCSYITMPPACITASEREQAPWSSDDDSSETFAASFGSSFSCACAPEQATECGSGINSMTATNERGNRNGSPHPLWMRGAPLRNAVCCRCQNMASMVCVICEEMVEGMYLWLLSCGHGGHVHHIQEWLQVSNECPCCGIPVLHSPEQPR